MIRYLKNKHFVKVGIASFLFLPRLLTSTFIWCDPQPEKYQFDNN